MSSCISAILILLSEWFRRVPFAPEAFTFSTVTWPVVPPEATSSTCCAKTGMSTLDATSAMSGVGGATTMELPVS